MSKELTVESVMKKPVITLRPTSSIMEAADLMRRENIGCIVVTEDEKPVGIVTERDIVRFIAIHGKEALDFPLSSLMSSPVVTCTPDTAVTKAYVMMYEKRIRRLPVVKNGKLVGIVTERDLIYWFLKMLGYPEKREVIERLK
ncbi:CBS domain-containing protein [Candidatus Methanodesulfokora washburnensis]|jgi:CBS domain-containing protein|uniref:CBS domain-containing protein n=1 Tax=Candidatus Methanodesulfokora washburnensis TaxID=2478471 RepID=A0A429GIL6_9CREN|nr:CBS domain-containing protein [Candidatus Methanodesulfokores washburnensis]RSN73701.1 CBS domain-containing protein [Candidatus Methanodesulfokores washburnensis]